MRRVEWVDAAKGLGILAVVLGHVAPHPQVLYWWHMPLFFFLSGYVFSSKLEPAAYVKRRATRLLVPYGVWVAILSLPTVFKHVLTGATGKGLHLLLADLYGGAKLGPPISTYWFLTALFFVSVGYRVLAGADRKWVAPCFCLLAYAAAMWRQFALPKTQFPLEIDATLIGLPFFCCGDWSKNASPKIVSCAIRGLSALFLLALFGFYRGVPIPEVDLKNAIYGEPVISFLIALGGSSLVVAIAKILPLTKLLAPLGQSSMVIMLLHQQVIVLTPKIVGNWWPVQFLLAVAIPFASYCLLARNPITRRWLLGEPSRPHLPVG